MKEKNYIRLMTDMDIYIKLTTLPDDMKKEVDNFIDFLKSKSISKGKVKKQRKAGLAKGLIQMKEGFDEPLDDFKDYM
ncbi:DUF2281 domain-containing protein [Aquiflexum sp.]|uniref:type II toxin-antitoxin system VapB family antitoxin n=1 Tax=Aquiflexum sp. TaxID=1872584 RepID=UPI0035934E81